MLVPTALVIITLLIAIAGAIYIAKRRVVDDEKPRSDLRPEDKPPEARVSL